MSTRFWSPYYIVNCILLLSYLPARYYFSHKELEKRDTFFGIPQETNIILVLVLFIVSKYRKRATIDAFLATVFLYLKTGLATLFYFLDKRIFGWYLVICAVLFLLLKQPKYEGPEDIVYFNPESFEQRILKARDKLIWIVYFYADWCENSIQHDALIAELSLKYCKLILCYVSGFSYPKIENENELRYSSNYLNFGKLDVSRYPEIAQEYSIDVSSSSHQLPTLILFEKGTETKRLPKFDLKGKVVKTILERKGVIAYFRIENLSDGTSKKNNN